MRFSEDGICEISSITSVDECEAYIKFLDLELARHQRAHNYAASVARDKERAALRFAAEAEFWWSSQDRHAIDVRAIPIRIHAIELHKATLEVE